MGLFDTSPLPSCSSELRSWTPRSLNYNEYANIFRTKTRLVLVSKLWRSLALELLYESVVLRKPRSLPSFIQALRNDLISTQSHNEKYPERLLRPATWFVRRLEIYAEALPEHVDMDMIDVFEHFSSLTVLTLDKIISEQVSDVLLHHILLSRCSLRHFQTKARSASLNTTIIESSRIALEFLSIETDNRHPFTNMAPKPFDLLLLHTVVLRHVLYGRYTDGLIMWLIKCQLPSLKCLIISGMIGREPLKSLFQSCGRTTTSLDLTYLDWRSNAVHLNTLPYFPLLQELTIHHRFLLHFPEGRSAQGLSYPSCPNLMRINLRIEFRRRHDFLERLMEDLAYNMSVIKDNFICSLPLEAPPIAPNLKCIHLTGISPTKFERTCFPGRDIDQWERWISEFRDAGVRFEFSTGDLVAIPVDMVHRDDEGWYLPEEGLGSLDGYRDEWAGNQ
jgi:hypothetical protein